MKLLLSPELDYILTLTTISSVRNSILMSRLWKQVVMKVHETGTQLALTNKSSKMLFERAGNLLSDLRARRVAWTYDSQEVEDKYSFLGSICLGWIRNRGSLRKILQLANSFSMLWMRQNVLEKTQMFNVRWRVMDQRKPGKFIMLVSILKFKKSVQMSFVRLDRFSTWSW